MNCSTGKHIVLLFKLGCTKWVSVDTCLPETAPDNKWIRKLEFAVAPHTHIPHCTPRAPASPVAPTTYP